MNDINDEDNELIDVIYEKLRVCDEDLNAEMLFKQIRDTHADIYQGYMGCYDICSEILEALDKQLIVYNNGYLQINDRKKIK